MSKLILEGNHINKEINVLTNKLLEHCKKEHDSIELGCDLGHLKALQICSPDNPTSNEGKELRARQDNML
eukprot:3521552-Ditylum_brightwellii.AAC.1